MHHARVHQSVSNGTRVTSVRRYRRGCDVGTWREERTRQYVRYLLVHMAAIAFSEILMIVHSIVVISYLRTYRENCSMFLSRFS